MTKSWYEQTLEEEEEDKDETFAQETVNKPVTGKEKSSSTMEEAYEANADPIREDEQKIMEEEDWMIEGKKLEFDDLMDDDDLLIDELQQI